MPATSKKQQKFMGIVRAIQKGEAPAGKFSKAAQKAAKSMKKSSVKKYAKTKHKGLPSKKEGMKKRVTVKEVSKWLKGLEEFRYRKIPNVDARRVASFINNGINEKGLPKSLIKKWEHAKYGREKHLANKYVSELDETTKRDYKAEYKKFQSSTKAKKYRAELNKYNRQKGTYGNGDGKDASHKGGKIVGFEAQSKNRGRAEKSRLKKEVSVNETKMSDKELMKYALYIKKYKPDMWNHLKKHPAMKKMVKKFKMEYVNENTEKAVKDMINRRVVKKGQNNKDRVRAIGKWLDDHSHEVSAKYNDVWIRRIKMGRGGQVQDWWGDTMSMISNRLGESVNEAKGKKAKVASYNVFGSMRELSFNLKKVMDIIDKDSQYRKLSSELGNFKSVVDKKLKSYQEPLKKVSADTMLESVNESGLAFAVILRNLAKHAAKKRMYDKMKKKKRESVDEGQKRMASTILNKFDQAYIKFSREVRDVIKMMDRSTGDKTDGKIIDKAYSKGLIPLDKLMQSWGRGQQSNPKIDEKVIKVSKKDDVPGNAMKMRGEEKIKKLTYSGSNGKGGYEIKGKNLNVIGIRPRDKGFFVRHFTNNTGFRKANLYYDGVNFMDKTKKF